MAVIPMRLRQQQKPQKSHRYKRRAQRVYAIAFDLDTTAAEKLCGANWRDCYGKIKLVLTEHGFGRVQGSVYFGDELSDPVRCILAVQDLDRRYVWFSKVLKDLRMLRVEDDNDLLPALSTRLRLGDDGEQVA